MQIRTLKEQYEIKDRILKERLDTLVAPLMMECGIDVWLIPSKEYNEDPIFEVLTPSGFPTARRVSILLLHNDHGVLKSYCINMHDHELEKYYTQDWDIKNETQFQALKRVLERCNPKTIGLNYSDDFAYCDGLSVGLLNLFKRELPETITDKFVSAEMLAIRFLETRSTLEMHYYPEVMALAMDIINDTYTKEVIKLGKTTCDDLEWYMKDRVNGLGLTFWFPPTIDVQRSTGMFSGDTLIEAGDLVHCDFGITYLGLCTDTQRLAYITKITEDKLPDELRMGMIENSHFQDIVSQSFKVGKTGNEIFSEALTIAAQENIQAMLYSHPLGIHGHAAGPTIGLYSDQKPQPLKGDLKMHQDTAYALELNTCKVIAGYQKPVFFFTEESVLFTKDKVEYLAKDRTEITVI